MVACARVHQEKRRRVTLGLGTSGGLAPFPYFSGNMGWQGSGWTSSTRPPHLSTGLQVPGCELAVARRPPAPWREVQPSRNLAARALLLLPATSPACQLAQGGGTINKAAPGNGSLEVLLPTHSLELQPLTAWQRQFPK